MIFSTEHYQIYICWTGADGPIRILMIFPYQNVKLCYTIKRSIIKLSFNFDSSDVLRFKRSIQTVRGFRCFEKFNLNFRFMEILTWYKIHSFWFYKVAQMLQMCNKQICIRWASIFASINSEADSIFLYYNQIIFLNFF